MERVDSPGPELTVQCAASVASAVDVSPSPREGQIIREGTHPYLQTYLTLK